MDKSEKLYLLDLPAEMLIEIIGYLLFNDLLSLSLVNKDFLILTTDSIEKLTKFKMKFPFPDFKVVSNMVRSYGSISMHYWDFVNEPDKLKVYAQALKTPPETLYLEVYFSLPDDSIPNSEFFKEFIRNCKRLKTIVISQYICELIELCTTEAPQIELKTSTATLSIDGSSDITFNPDFLEFLYLHDYEDPIPEIDLIKHLEKFRNLKHLQTYYIVSAENASEVSQYMKDLNFFNLHKMKELDFYHSENISEDSQFLSLFQNLESLLCHCKNVDDDYNPKRFAFAKTIYKNNWKTLKTLSLKLLGASGIENFLPDIRIQLKELNFSSRHTDTHTHTTELLIKLLEQQSGSLEKISLQCIRIDSKIFEILSKLAKLKEIYFDCCECCDLSLSRKSSRALKVQTKICLGKSKISFLSTNYKTLNFILENEGIQNNIERLGLRNLPRTERIEKLVFPKLKNLVYDTHGENVPDFMKRLEAPLLEALEYGYRWGTAQTIQKFLNLKVLKVHQQYETIDEIQFLMTLDKLEVLEICLSLSILHEALDEVSKELPNLKFCKISCAKDRSMMKRANSEEMFEICKKFNEDKPFNFESHKNEEESPYYAKISNLNFTIYIYSGEWDPIYYYDGFVKSFFESEDLFTE